VEKIWMNPGWNCLPGYCAALFSCEDTHLSTRKVFMKFTISMILLASLSVVSCDQATDPNATTTDPSTTDTQTTTGDTPTTTPGDPTTGTTDPTPPVTGTDTSVPNEALTFDTSGVTTNNATEAQDAKVQKALELIRKVIASEEFRDKVLNFSYNGKKAFVDNGGFTNEQIYQKILDAAELKYPDKNNRMDMDVSFYYNGWTSTVGYTTAGSTGINVNTKFFNSYDASGVADNLAHEWMHKLGFDHATYYSVSRDYSVPYGIGYMIEAMAKKLLQAP